MKQKIADKERGLELFKKITGIRRSRELRKEKDYRWQNDDFGRYHTHGLGQLLDETREELKAFWQKRTEKCLLFDTPYVWQPWEDHVTIGPRILGNNIITSFFPKEETVRLLIGLSEHPCTLDVQTMVEVRDAYRNLYNAGLEQQIDMLVTVLHFLAMPKLIDALEGPELAELLRAAWRVETCIRTGYPENTKGTVEKVVESLYREKLESLVDHCVLAPSGVHEVILTLREHAGEKGKFMAQEIIKRLERAFNNLKRTLEDFDGNSVTNP